MSLLRASLICSTHARKSESSSNIDQSSALPRTSVWDQSKLLCGLNEPETLRFVCTFRWTLRRVFVEVISLTSRELTHWEKLKEKKLLRSLSISLTVEVLWISRKAATEPISHWQRLQPWIVFFALTACLRGLSWELTFEHLGRRWETEESYKVGTAETIFKF